MFNVAQTYTAGFGSPQGSAVSVPAPATVQKPEVVDASVDAPAKLASPSVDVQISAQVNPTVVEATPEIEATRNQNSAVDNNAPTSSSASADEASAPPVPESVASAIGGERSGDKEVQAAAEEALAEAERQEVQALKARDQEVRRHEQAHASAGGVYAGAPKYEFTTGPDGGRYAVGGEVSIDASPVPGDPQATLEKAQTVRRAALAPAEPSEQDRRVAAEASQMAAQARVELLQLQRSDEDTSAVDDDAAAQDETATQEAAEPVLLQQSQQATPAETTLQASREQAEQEAETEAEADRDATRPALLYSDDDEGDETETDAAASGVSARERFEQVYGNVSAVAQQLTAIADWTAAQPAIENLLDDIV